MIATGVVSYDVNTYISSCRSHVCGATAERLSESGECQFNPADLSLMERIQFLTEELGKTDNKFDILVNNVRVI